LSGQFVAGGYDLKSLIRAICLSDAYQRTSKPAAGNEKDAFYFSHMTIKALTGEQLYDSLVTVMGAPGQAAGPRAKAAALPKRAGGNARDQFVAFFTVAEVPDATQYEAGIPQALRLMNNPQIWRNERAAAAITRPARSKADAVERLYVAVLSRRPTADEAKRMAEYVEKHSTDAAYNDILWALMNSSEFALCR
jgi:Protein of unknown function (DUF1553)